MPQIIEVPDIGLVEFPDGMDDAAIVSAIEANRPKPVQTPAIATIPRTGEERDYQNLQMAKAGGLNLVADVPSGKAWESLKAMAGDAMTPIVEVGKKLGITSQTLADAADTIYAYRGAAGMGEMDWEAAKTKLGEMPQRDPGGVEKVAAGTQQAVVHALDFFTSPVGVATLGMSALPATAQKVIAGAFTVSMAKQLPEQVNELADAITSEDTERISKGLAGLGLSTVFIAKGVGAVAAKSPIGTIAEKAEEAKAPATAEAIRQLETRPAEKISELEISPQAVGITPKQLSTPIKALGEMIGKAIDFYATPLTERLANEGGTQAKGFANMAREVSQRSKELYGSITPVLDPALEATGALNKSTTWLNDIAPTTNPWGYRNAVTAVEGPIGNVPAAHRPTVDLLKTANLEIGKMPMSVVPGYVATGKYQRQPTAFLVDTVRSGRGPAHDLLVRALAAENKVPAARIRSNLKDIKAEFDAPGSQQTVHKIAQEFERVFPKFPTDLKIGGVWTPILHAKPFEYLQNAALSTAQRVAFLERVPQGTLGQLREGIVAELKSPEAFDELVRALHGLPVDQPSKLFTPGSAAGMMASGANRILGDIFSPIKLTASAIYNIPETLLGNTPAFGGWKNFLRGAVELKGRHAALEQMGAINKNIYNWSFDPKAPIRSIMSDFRNGVRKTTLQQFFNEMQEMLAASTAQVFAEQAQARSLSPREQRLFADTARAMGFERPAAEAMGQGRGTSDQYENFVRRAAAFKTGGNIQAAEQSRFGGSRVLGGLFRFQSYPMMKLNAHNKAWRNAVESWQSGDSKRIASSTEQLAKFLFGTTAQGAATVFLASFLRGGETGTEIKAEEAKDEPGEFLLDSLLSGIGGPISAINYAVGSGRGHDLLNPETYNASKTFPGSVYMEMMELFRGKGAFKDLSLPDALGKYVTEKIPAGKIGRTALAAAGLSQHNTALDESIRAFYRWRREELGYTQEKNELAEDARAQFRQHMKKAVESIKQGKDFVPELIKAAGQEGATRKSLASSMRARTILKAPDGKKLSPEQSEALKKRIGNKAYDRIFWHDAMVEAVADAIQ